MSPEPPDDSLPVAPPPWRLATEAVLAQLGSGPDGLADEDAAVRLARFGPNEVPGAGWSGIGALLWRQFSSPLVLVLVGAAVLSGVLGHQLEASVILSIVVVNGALGFVQEHRAERTLRELARLIVPQARVRRAGRELEVATHDLVPGDLVRLGIGDLVPADLVLLEAQELAVDESTLTGESQPVAKRVGAGEATGESRAQPANAAFLGTSVAAGRALGVVFATGERTQLGRTAASLGRPSEPSEFERGLARFSRFLLGVTLALTAFVFAANALLGRGVVSSLLFALALAVGITPEALPAVITVALSRGAARMARERAVIKRLGAVEDLGNIDTLCCDKTGTLTLGAPALVAAVDTDGGADERVARLARLATASDNSLDRGLLASPLSESAQAWLARCTRLDANEFDFERRRVSATFDGPEGRMLAVKGAPEAVFAACVRRRASGVPLVLTPDDVVRLQARVAAWEADGQRAIAVASRALERTLSSPEDERELDLEGFLLFSDPPKPTAASSLAELHGLGIELKLISGDSASATRRACDDVRLPIPEDRVVTGDEIAGLDEPSLRAMAHRFGVFARVTPEQKRRLVAALRRDRHIVGFLGDGVNDAPALHAADVGISVDGATGIAREAADILLLEKDLGVLGRGIVEGRRTFGNITKYVLNTVSANFGNMATVALSSLFLRFLPLLPSQILLNNLVSDLPLLALAGDRVDSAFLARPRRWSVPTIAHFMVWFGLLSALFDLLLLAALVRWPSISTAQFRTAWFLESALSEIAVTFAIRSHAPLFQSRPSATLALASALGAAVAAALPAIPDAARWFGFAPLTGGLSLLVGGTVLGYFACAEALKRWFFREEAAR